MNEKNHNPTDVNSDTGCFLLLSINKIAIGTGQKRILAAEPYDKAPGIRENNPSHGIAHKLRVSNLSMNNAERLFY